ncbi:nuclear receptor 2C2-associated protein isoform X2 [Zootermopsis nevadensis]|uniref:nuclear receptor 2C2-associated protein isoform X2 n=1 Tax=Zootermopsis nevadensis TaxID=136037 RepID=UPI000B8E8401|nr:nuclear receptor 2C2-associated protein isoform X2 [Zootermopsis nevadensis]
MTSVLKEGTFDYRVSSVLNRDVKQFGKKHLFDDDEETCWNSDQGSPQWIDLNLHKKQTINTFHIQFQGGFVGRDCHLEAGFEDGSLEIVEHFYPEDINSLQIFKLKKPISAKHLRFVFKGSTDFFGRIVIYKLEILSTT